MSFSKRLYLLLLIAVSGLIALTALVTIEIGKVYDATNLININVNQSMEIADRIRDNFLHIRIKVRSLSMLSDPARLPIVEQQIAKARQGVYQAIDQYMGPDGCQGTPCIFDSIDDGNIRTLKQLWIEYDARVSDEFVTAKQNLSDHATMDRVITANIPLAEQVDARIADLVNYNLVISKKLSDEADRTRQNAIRLAWVISAATIIVVLLSGLLIIRFVLKALGGDPAGAAAIANDMAIGRLSTEIALRPGDSSSMMAAIKTLRDTLNRLSGTADQISTGNLNQQVTILSEHDRLGEAIHHMQHSLRDARALDQRRNWLADGSKMLNQALIGDYNVQQIAGKAATTVGHYLGAGRAALYVLQDDGSVLHLGGSYMLNENGNGRTSFRVGEGLIGQVAQDRQPILIDIADPDTDPVITGTSQKVPTHLYAYPLLHDTNLIGVLEVASFQKFDDTMLEMLARAAESIAPVLYIANQREKINQLLLISEQAERATRSQNEQLQDINARMEEQQQQLQQQSEELQQSNAMMEEQHQQMQQQSEELRQANEQMVEQQKMLEVSNEELRLSKSFIDDKAKQLEQSNHYKSEFLANMSHELRTPLNAIILLSKMMSDNREGTLVEADVKKSEVINRAGKDLLRLINDVLDLSKVDAGRMDLQIEPVSTAALIANLQDLFGTVQQASGVQLVVRDTVQGMLHTDPDKLGQVLRNLLSNAFKFTKKGSVTLSFERDDTQALPIRIKVTDTGIGIPQDKLTTVFEAFRQVDGSISREFGGTGLGLTISLRLARLLGGTIELRSEPGQGTEFTVALPLTTPADQTGATILSKVADVPKPAPSVPSSRAAATRPVLDDRDTIGNADKVILIIDDDVEFCRAVVEINHRLGYKTVVAHTAAESVELAQLARPEGILLDLGLPDRDGIDLLHDLKADAELASIPVYIVSARDRDSHVPADRIVGYIQKPVNEDQIASAVGALLVNAFGPQPPARVLVVAADAGTGGNLVQRIRAHFGEGCAVGLVQPDAASLREATGDADWAAAIINMGGLSVDQAVNAAQALRVVNPSVCLLFYGADNLSDDEEVRLRAYTDSIIASAATAEQRLLDNTERFLRDLKETSARPAAQHPVARGKRLAGRSVLVIDDDIRNLFVLTAALEQEGAHVLNASNGRRAMDMLEYERVDIIITDIMMPEMDGYQTIAAVRANPKLQATPIIALSAKAMPEDRKNIIEAGADDYLSKPVDYEMLSNMTALWCAKPQRQ